MGAAKLRAAQCILGTEKNYYIKNYEGLGITEKEKKRDTDGTVILFLIPWYFSVKYQGIKEQYYSPACVSSCFFSFSVIPNPS